MPKNLPLARPLMGVEEERAVAQVLRSRWLVQGPRVAEFESAVSRFSGAGHAVALSSCTSALYLCLRAAGIGPGNDVLVPGFTFVATANSVVHTGATPVFADIDLDTFNLSPKAVAETIDKRYRRRGTRLVNRSTGHVLRLLMIVHQFGLAADLGRLGGLARRHGVKILEDAACALGTRYRGRHVGRFGIAGCLSFHARKTISTGEGGMVLTRDRALAARVRMLRDHGAALSDHARHAKGVTALPDYPVSGFNSRMTDLQGAIGVEQMKRLPDLLNRRANLAKRYQDRLRGVEGIAVPTVPPSCGHTWQSYVIRFPQNSDRCDHAARELRDQGISTRPGTHAIPWLTAFAGAGEDREACPNSRSAERTSMALPLFPEMSFGDVDRVCAALRALKF